MTGEQTPESPAAEHRDGRRPKNRRARIAQLIIAGATALLLAAFGGVAAMTWPGAANGAAGDLPSGSGEEWMQAADIDLSVERPAWVNTLNAALESGDREQFLSVASGQGAEALGRWWDGTERIGRTLSFAQAYDYMDTYEPGKPPSYLMLGAQLSFAAQPARGSGSEDAGLQLTQNFPYELTLDGEGDDAKITGLTPKDSPQPWDEGEIHVAKRDHVVVYGLADERAFVEANADLAEEAAVLTFETLEKIGGEAPIEGFVVAFTEREDRFMRWFGHDVEMGAPSGFAAPTARPRDQDDVPPTVAVGDRSAGSIVALGPGSASNPQRVLVHEFAHVIQDSAVPIDSMFPLPRSSVEGFARYFELEAGVLERPFFQNPEVQARIAAEGESAMSNERLLAEDAHIAYNVAGSFYQFVADSGGSPWQLALDRDNALTMGLRAKLQNEAFGEAEWQAWAASH